MQKIILASGSPRRKQLLEWAEVPFEVIVSNIDETYPPTLLPERVPVYIALQKAIDVKEKLSAQNADQIILAADTVVVLNSTIIGKPKDREHAIQILTSISGKIHKVITGVVFLYKGKEISFSDVTSVEFYPLTLAEIEYYVNKYKPYDKAGAYAIQEWIGVTGIKTISGDFYNVMGLPVSRVVKELKSLIAEE